MADVYVTSAFSKNNKGGNKAGIILDMPHLEYSKKTGNCKESWVF